MDEKIDYLIEHMPFRQELIQWCKEHGNFVDALKLINSDQFVVFNGVSLVQPPTKPDDEVIGIVVYDLRRGFLKQDFVVDNGSLHNSFTLYSKLPMGKTSLYESGVVQHIKDFYKKYDDGGKYFQNTHYPDILSLDPELQQRISDYLSLTKRTLMAPPAS